MPFPRNDVEYDKKITNLAENINNHRAKYELSFPRLKITGVYNVLEKLRREEPLTKKEQEIKDHGLVSVLHELHDELDRAVFAAYGWEDLGEALVGMPGATTPLPDKSDVQAVAEEELLTRLVKLNKQRAAEEAQGKIRWLRPDYQAPDAKQTDIELSEKLESKTNIHKAKTKKIKWPKEMREQINLLIDLLSIPATSKSLIDNFSYKPAKQVIAVLDALEALGKAQQEDGIWYLS